MADDKKPKIDLKSRLQKMGGPAAATPPPPVAGGMALPGPPPPQRPPGAPIAPPSIPPPSGIPRPMISQPAPPLDPNNPLAAVAQPFKQPASSRPGYGPAPVAIAQPQRIEIDEGAIQQARSGARKQGMIVGLLIAVMLAVIGWIGGGASQKKADRDKGVSDAHELAGDLSKAKASLDQIKAAVTDGGKSIVGDRKFPTDLQQKLAGMNVDFAGDKLFGRRFSGVPADTTSALFDFITRVAALNQKKDLIVSLLSKLAKPITEELARPAGQSPISLIGIVDKNTGDTGLLLGALVTPILPDAKEIPDKLTFTNPRGSGNVVLPRLSGDKIPATGAAITVIPSSFDKVCPSPVKGQISQLMTSMNSLIDDIQGVPGGDTDPNIKPGLADTANKLVDSLNKVN
jgi:hypothetical protein